MGIVQQFRLVVQNVATSGVRDRRMQRTRHALVEHARALTAERGLAGFTVEELCTRVGVSRRTFFNYFPTKEDAVLGSTPPDLTEEERAHFIARGRHDGPGLSPTLLSDIARLALVRCHGSGLIGDHPPVHRDIVRSEPHLLARIFAIGETRQRALAELIALREGLPPEDPRPRLAVKLIMGLAFDAVDELLADDNPFSFEELLERNFAFGSHLLGQHLDLTPPTGTS